MLKLLRFLLFAAGALLLVSNIEPYIAITRLVFTSSGANAINVCAELQPIPFIGGLLSGSCSAIGATIYSAAGFLVWAVFQILELLPIANNFNIPFLSGVLHRLQKAPQVEPEYRDRDAVQHLKTKHNTVVERSLSALLTFSWLTYFVDLALMCWLYSPLNAVGELQPMALVRVLLGVFGVEVVILGLTLISNIIDPSSIRYPKSAQQPYREY